MHAHHLRKLEAGRPVRPRLETQTSAEFVTAEFAIACAPSHRISDDEKGGIFRRGRGSEERGTGKLWSANLGNGIAASRRFGTALERAHIWDLQQRRRPGASIAERVAFQKQCDSAEDR